ncbi:MAG: mobile mystery protein B [Simkaniaceae bacterium]|nr:mobile mystery protein B [Simkaniaceae bacterium]
MAQTKIYGMKNRSSPFLTPEGATPINDCSDLIPEWVLTMEDLNRVESENIIKATRKFLTPPINHPLTWLSPKFLKHIHHNMFCHVWKWAGKYRKSVTSIGITPYLIPSQLAEFCHSVYDLLDSPSPSSSYELAAKVHHRLVFIHPFENGNGRFSRLIADRFLLSLGEKHPLWPSSLNSNNSTRNRYISALQSADQGNYTPLLTLMLSLSNKKPG